jgi:type I restriction enzyme S subunit
MTEIGEIPVDWDIHKFSEIAETVKGSAPKNLPATGEELKIYPYLSADYLRGNAEKTQYFKISNRKTNKIVNEDEIILIWDGSNAGEFFIGNEGLLSSTMVKLVFKTFDVVPRFIYYYMKKEENKLKKTVKGSTIPHVNGDSLLNLYILLPPVPEQKKIAEVLSTADETIQKVNEEIALTEKLKKGLMQTLLTKGIGHTKFKMTEIGEIPEEWNVKELYQVSELRKETIGPIKKMSEHYVGLENISSGQLRIFSYGDATNLKSSKFKFKKGDILYGKLRPYLDKVALAETDGVCSTDIIPILSKNMNARFLAYMLHSDLFLQFVKSTISGTNHPRTAWKQMSHFLMPFPSISEQQKITEILTTVDSKRELLRNKKAHLEKLKKGLMGDLLTGKVRAKINTSKGEN